MTPEERDLLAGEYALGTLTAAEAQAVEAAMAGDPALAAQVLDWQRRLAPLTALAAPEAPPPGLWARIEASLNPAPPPRARAPWLTRFWALGATAVAAGLAVVVLARQPALPPGPLMTVLLTDREAPAFLVEADRRDGEIRLAALNNRPVPEGRVRQLWALPQGATAPTSLGLVPEDGRISVRHADIRPEPGMLIEITLEPPGGSPIGRPTGPVLFIGRLLPARGT